MLSSKSSSKHKRKKGFSLLEIVVSLGLIALFIIPVGNMIMGTVKISKSSEHKQQAISVLQETAEKIRGLDSIEESLYKDITITGLDEDEVVSKIEEVINKYSSDEVQIRSLDADNKRFHIARSSNEYGIEVKGFIECETVSAEREVVTDSSDVGLITIDPAYSNTPIIGAIYLGRQNWDGNRITLYMNNNMKISDAVSRISGNREIWDSVNIDFHKKGQVGNEISVNVNWEKYFSDESINNPNFLVIVDRFIGDININFSSLENVVSYDSIKLYVYNKNNNGNKCNLYVTRSDSQGDGSSKLDFQESVKDITKYNNGDSSEGVKQGLGIKKYSVKLTGYKEGKALETLDLEFIK